MTSNIGTTDEAPEVGETTEKTRSKLTTVQELDFELSKVETRLGKTVESFARTRELISARKAKAEKLVGLNVRGAELISIAEKKIAAITERIPEREAIIAELQRQNDTMTSKIAAKIVPVEAERDRIKTMRDAVAEVGGVANVIANKDGSLAVTAPKQ